MQGAERGGVAYTYNAPGIGSSFSNIWGLLGLSSAIPFDLNMNLVGQGQTFEVKKKVSGTII